LQARRTKKAPRKKTSIVRAAIKSSALGKYHGLLLRVSGTPNVARPSARLIILSKCSRAAIVAGEVVADSTDRAVAVDGMGGGTWVARNIWYV
jgi:hypothetical protein